MLKLMVLSHEYKAQVVTTAFIVDRSVTPIDFGVPKVSLAQIDIPTYAPDECPMCQVGMPLRLP